MPDTSRRNLRARLARVIGVVLGAGGAVVLQVPLAVRLIRHVGQPAKQPGAGPLIHPSCAEEGQVCRIVREDAQPQRAPGQHDRRYHPRHRVMPHRRQRKRGGD
jgi:hypothetical protein